MNTESTHRVLRKTSKGVLLNVLVTGVIMATGHLVFYIFG